MIRVELAQARAMGSVATLELRTQEYPKLTEEIKEYCLDIDGEKQAYYARIAVKAVGHAFVVFDDEAQTCTIESIGVLPEFRKTGVGRALVDKITKDTEDLDYSVKIRVASYAVTDTEDPWCIEQWLWKLGFKATGTDGVCFRYGQDYDIYLFERIT